MRRDVTHVVEQGESIESLARDYNLSWQSLWDHPRNRALRERRQDPHVLAPGDQVYIPESGGSRTAAARTGQVNRFTLRRAVSRLHLVLRVQGQVLADTPYALEVGDLLLEGRSGPDGSIRHEIPANLGSGRIRVGTGFSAIVMPLHLRSVDPLSTLSGVQGRLRNLGYPVREVTGTLDAATRAALARFRADQGLPPGEEVDAGVESALRTAYGH